jgi:hypothetical protein
MHTHTWCGQALGRVVGADGEMAIAARSAWKQQQHASAHVSVNFEDTCFSSTFPQTGTCRTFHDRHRTRVDYEVGKMFGHHRRAGTRDAQLARKHTWNGCSRHILVVIGGARGGGARQQRGLRDKKTKQQPVVRVRQEAIAAAAQLKVAGGGGGRACAPLLQCPSGRIRLIRVQ